MKVRLHRLTLGIPVVCLATVAVMATGCNKQIEPSANAAAVAPAKFDIRIPPEPNAASTPKAKEPVRTPRVRHVRPRKPHIQFTMEDVEQRHAAIQEMEDFTTRLELRRALMHHLVKDDATDAAHAELADLLADVAASEGNAMAHRVGYAEAGTFFGRKRFQMAKIAYRLVISGYPDGPYLNDARLHLGDCLMEQCAYVEAAATWGNLIESRPKGEVFAWAHRKLAVAQLLMGQFDASLATLKALQARASDATWKEYAAMRRGYVLTAANRIDEARESYATFLRDHPASRYVPLVKRHLDELDTAVQVARR